LESAQDYATQLDADNISYHETGYALCKRVIDLPKKYASAAHSSALAEGIVGQFTSNQYSRKYAAQDARGKMNKANERKKEIESASFRVNNIMKKYYESIKVLNPAHGIVVRETKKNKQVSDNKVIDKYAKIGAVVGCAITVIILLMFEPHKQNISKIYFYLILFVPTVFGIAVGRRKAKNLLVSEKRKTDELEIKIQKEMAQFNKRGNFYFFGLIGGAVIGAFIAIPISHIVEIPKGVLLILCMLLFAALGLFLADKMIKGRVK
jgi:Flp pilus assembly protein TadB